MHKTPLYSFIPIHTHTHTFPLCTSPVKYTIGTFLITVVSRGNHVKCISFYLQTDKGRRRKEVGADCCPHGLPQALSWPAFLSGIVPASRNVIHSAVFIFPHLSLTLEASKSKGRRKRRGRDGDRRASLIRTKAQWTPEACGVSWPEARASSNMKDE